MQLIVIKDSRGSKSYNITAGIKQLTVVFTLCLMAAVFMGGVYTHKTIVKYDSSQLKADIARQEGEISKLKSELAGEVAAVTDRLSRIHARTLQLIASRDAILNGLGMVNFAEEFDISVDDYSTASDLTEIEDRMARIQTQYQILASTVSNRTYDRMVTPNIEYTKVSSGFGRRMHPILNTVRHHSGVDIPMPEGTEIPAPAGGLVVFSGYRGDYGNVVEIDHGNGYTTLFAHNKENLVEVGDVVKAGDIIATVGTTGLSTSPHIHVEIRRGNALVNPAHYMARL